MARSTYPQFSESRAPIWPKVVLFALIAALAAGLGVLFALGVNPLEDLQDDGQPSGQLAVVVDPTATISDEVPSDATSTEEPAEEAIQSDATVPSEPDESAPEPTPEPALTAVPTETAEPVDVVTLFADRWVKGDYPGMYALLSSDAKSAISEEDFVARYTGISEEAGIYEVEASTNGEVNLDLQAPLHSVLKSARVGEIEQDATVQLRQEDGNWTIAWTPSLIFSALNDDCVDFTAEDVNRGAIHDRNGEILAFDGIVNEVGVIPGQFENESAELKALAKVTGLTVSQIKEKYKDAEPDWFVPVKDLPDPIDTDVLNEISELPGVALRSRTARVYPHGALTAHVTGYVSEVTAEDIAQNPEAGYVPGEMIGRAGIEAGANDLLSGQPGGRLSIVDCASRAELEVIGQQPVVPPQDLTLTIDVEFQEEVDRALGDVRGSAVVIDPRNGAILAMVSHPSFDPNLFVTGLTEKQAAEMFNETERPLINRAAQQGYPTGSIFKAITTAAAMEDLGYEGGSEFYCPTSWSIPGSDQVWHDWTFEYGAGDQGSMNLHNALVNSCNTIFYQLAYELDQADEDLLPDMAKAFGLGTALGVPYLPEINGTVPSPDWKLEEMGDYWATGDAVNLAIGQGYLLATPLQMANAYAAIANGGTLLQPYIVEYTSQPDGVETKVGKRTVIRELPISGDHIAEIQSALRDQTSNSFGAGSSQVFGGYDWPIAGKTGTAQIQAGRNDKPHAWFAAFGPYGDEATIASIVMVESSGEGVTFAAPPTMQIYDSYRDSDLANVSDS